MEGKCGHKSKKLLQEKVTNFGTLAVIFLTLLSKMTYPIVHECADCGEKRTETINGNL